MRLRRFALLVLCFLFASSTTAFAAVSTAVPGRRSAVAVAAVDPDGDIPGTPALSLNSDHLDATTDPHDVYSKALQDGDILTVQLDAPEGTYFDIYLYGPDQTTIAENALHGWISTAYPARLVHEVAEGEAGTYYIDIRAWEGSGDYDMRTFVNHPVSPGSSSHIMRGEDRIATSIAVSNGAFYYGCDTVIIATGYDWPDALSAGALGGVASAPILLTRGSSLDPRVADEITRLGAKRAYIVGGEAAVSATVENSLDLLLGSGNVTRLAGANRYQTSYEVAREVAAWADAAGFEPASAFVVTGGTFPDALSVGPLACSMTAPILLESPSAGLSSGLASYVNEAGFTDLVIIGGSGAVDATTETQLKGLPAVEFVGRWAGDNRYETAAVVSSIAIDYFMHVPDRMAFASGENFPDALAGAVGQGLFSSVLLTVKSTSVPDSTASVEYFYRKRVSVYTVLGGPAVISDDLRSEISYYLRLP